ncbi:phage major capsid protein [Mycolicibacterium lutetiense]|uniref:HK97 family phage major capsid protein n=1 Tax=Mycolicibacterium lutetiense TaxID=1641992 RepID=A0ABS4ZPD7_9MYCO|nr:phage major capsid protein [Mycolicibacterium lutetiense]MBP2450504.1 HK97 family phage major capsid protein [Mycolicibacterium lutetiense]
MAPTTTTTAAQVWRPDENVFAPQDALPDAAILTHSTVSATIEGDAPSMRVGYVSDAAAAYHNEGADLTVTDPSLSEIEVITQEIGFYHEMTRDQYRKTSTPEQLAASVARSITKLADKSFLSEANPTSPAVRPIGGLENYTGLSTQTAVATNIDKLVDLESTVHTAGATPTAWVMAPDAWAILRKMKQVSSGGNLGLLGAGTSDALPYLLSIPVYVNSQMSSKTGLLVDKNEIISAVSGLEVDVDHSAAFKAVKVAVRGTWRIGYGVPRPDRIGKFVLT